MSKLLQCMEIKENVVIDIEWIVIIQHELLESVRDHSPCPKRSASQCIVTHVAYARCAYIFLTVYQRLRKHGYSARFFHQLVC